MASNCKYAKGILISSGFMSVWCVVQICFHEAFKIVSQQCYNVENTIISNLPYRLRAALLLNYKSWISVSPSSAFSFFSSVLHSRTVSCKNGVVLLTTVSLALRTMPETTGDTQ